MNARREAASGMRPGTPAGISGPIFQTVFQTRFQAIAQENLQAILGPTSRSIHDRTGRAGPSGLRWLAALLAGFVGAASGLAHAAEALPGDGPVYQCAPRSYSQAPCPGGKPIALRDGRSPDDVARAIASLQAEQLEAHRLRQAWERSAADERTGGVIGRLSGVDQSARQRGYGASRPSLRSAFGGMKRQGRPHPQLPPFGLSPEGASAGPRGIPPIIPVRP